ncbi:MAG: hypothetical protein JNM94_10460 [Phycisphaerae bacterium]|nr:hypothetical protein [Phycisphaerae bacterium]
MSRLECPRCSYDQAGTVATWTDSCPLATRCTECGFEIDIPQLHRDAFERLPWWVEHTRGAWRTIAAAIIAPVIACLPWWLYRRLRMSHSPRLRRLLIPFVVYVGGWYFLISMIATIRGLAALPRLSRLLDVPQAFLGGFVPFEIELLNPFYLPQYAARAAWWRAFESSIEAIAYTVWIVMTVLAATVAFAVLPIARRRAKLRWKHVARGGLVIAWTSPVMAALTWPFAYAIGVAMGNLGGVELTLALACTTCVAQTILWHAVVRRHFRMERPLAVALSVSTLGILGVTTAIMVLASLG